MTALYILVETVLTIDHTHLRYCIITQKEEDVFFKKFDVINISHHYHIYIYTI